MIYYNSKDLEGPLKIHAKLDSNTLEVIAQIRRALSILFHFARKLSPNKVILANSICFKFKIYV